MAVFCEIGCKVTSFVAYNGRKCAEKCVKYTKTHHWCAVGEFSVFRFLCPSETGGEEGRSEGAPNVLPYPLRGALPSATMDPKGAQRAEGVC